MNYSVWCQNIDRKQYRYKKMNPVMMVADSNEYDSYSSSESNEEEIKK